MNPKYSIGEVVILQSVTYPEFNGEHTVRCVLSPETEYHCRVSNKDLRNINRRTSYILEDICQRYDEDYKVVREINWSESALRKKHQRGDYSFSELISTLKIGEKA